MVNPLTSLARYSQFIAESLDRPDVERSTVAVWSESTYTGVAEGEILFRNGIRLREELDFADALITSYGYEVYRGDDRLFWYDDFPHPEDPGLAKTLPHHKHVPPDIKHHRIPAPQISFELPNVPRLLREIEELDGSSGARPALWGVDSELTFIRSCWPRAMGSPPPPGHKCPGYKAAPAEAGLDQGVRI